MDQPLTNPSIEGAIQYIEMVLKSETLTPMAQHYLNNALTLLRRK